jgi:cell wall-associated NlpC family hydrolase
MKLASDFVGIPYADLDCYALVRVVSSEVYGLNLPDFPDYVQNAEAIIAKEKASGHWAHVERAQAKAGDIVTMSPVMDSGRHVGILIENGLVLHTSIKYGSLIQMEKSLVLMGFQKIDFFRFNP